MLGQVVVVVGWDAAAILCKLLWKAAARAHNSRNVWQCNAVAVTDMKALQRLLAFDLKVPLVVEAAETISIFVPGAVS